MRPAAGGGGAAGGADVCPPPSRFAHLLQPIRDVAANWAVDVAAELESYLVDIESAEAELSATDFTTAALLVQGSAGVYARKVEHLYSLVFRALDLLRTHGDGSGGGSGDGAEDPRGDGSGGGGGRGRDRRAAGDLYDVEVEWGPLDTALPQAGDGLDLPPPKPVAGLGRDYVLAVVPIALLPPPPVRRVVGGGGGGDTPAAASGGGGGGGAGGGGGGSSDFRMDTATVHSSGALLLDEDVGEAGGLGPVGGAAAAGDTWFMGGSAAFSDPTAVDADAGDGGSDWGADNDDRPADFGGSLPGDGGDGTAMDVDDRGDGGRTADEEPGGAALAAAPDGTFPPPLPLPRRPPLADFRLYDPHERPAAPSRPLRRAITYRRPLQDGGGGGGSVDGIDGSALSPVPSLLGALAADMTSAGWLLTAALGPPPPATARGPRWVGVAELAPAVRALAAAMAASRRWVAQVRARAAAAAAAAASGRGVPDDALDEGDFFADDEADAYDGDGGGYGGEGGGGGDDGGDDLGRMGEGGGRSSPYGGAGGVPTTNPFDAPDFDFFAADETEDAVRSLAAAYDAACRRYVAESAAAWERHAADPALASRVSEWAARVTPALEAEAVRPPFDIAAVGVDVLVRFGTLAGAAAAEEAALGADALAVADGDDKPPGATDDSDDDDDDDGSDAEDESAESEDGGEGEGGDRRQDGPAIAPGRRKAPLSGVVGGAPKVDVCRRFLAALQLAADGKIVLDVAAGVADPGVVRTRVGDAVVAAILGGGSSPGRRG
ncbi:hypothetical protein MMPV_000605 [Pyropia vietnamensis]